jgi:hypothetical protein
MIFRRASTRINWRYALGELSLIIVGVSIALAASSWYENRVDRRLEREALTQLKAELEADLIVIRANYKDLETFEKHLDLLLEHARSDDTYSDVMQPYFSGIASWRTLRVRTATYEEIKNHGFSLISDSGLRAQIIDLYEGQFPALIGASNVDSKFTQDRILPYMYERFLRIPGSGWRPLDYSTIRSDPVFENIIMSKQQRLKGRLLPRHKDLADSIVNVINRIDNVLAIAG